MFEPLATKVKMSELGPKCQYFVRRPLFSSTALKVEAHWPNRWTSEVFGETRTRSGTICSVCLVALEASGAVWTASAPIQHAKSKGVGCWPTEPLDSLIGCVPTV